MMTKKILIIILFMGFNLTVLDTDLWAGTGGTPAGQEVDLVEIKKKEEERRKKTKKSTRVITNDDLEKIKKERANITEISKDPSETSGSEQKKASDQSDKNKEEIKKIDPRTTEKYWRDKKKLIEDNIKKNEEAIKRLEERFAQLRTRLFINADIFSQRQQIEKEYRETFSKLNNYKRGLENLKKALEDLHDEARQAGVPPGWLRD